MPGDKVIVDGETMNPKEALAFLQELTYEKQYPEQIIVSCKDNRTYYFLKGAEYKIQIMEKTKLVSLPGTISMKTVIERLETMCFAGNAKKVPNFTVEEDDEEDYSDDFNSPSESLAASPQVKLLEKKAQQLYLAARRQRRGTRSVPTRKHKTPLKESRVLRMRSANSPHGKKKTLRKKNRE
jgi:hypothetical protein